jgi:hypothetical protein
VLITEGVLLIAMGAGGLLGNATTTPPPPQGASVPLFHLTTLHSTILLVTGLLASLSAARRTTALIRSTDQAAHRHPARGIRRRACGAVTTRSAAMPGLARL